VIIKEGGTNKILSKNKIYIAPNSNKSYIDISKVLDNLVKTPIDNSDTILKNLNGTVSYFLEVTGVSGSGAVTDTKITTSVMSCFNGKLNNFDLYNGVMNAYYMQTGYISKFLTDRATASYLHYTANEHLYFLADADSDVFQIKIQYQYHNNSLSTYSLPFKDNGQLLHRLNLSPSALGNTIGLDLDNLKNIKVWLENTGGVAISQIRQYNLINYQCGLSIANINWINDFGGLSSNTFIAPKETKQVSKTTLNTNGYLNRVAGVYSPIEKVLSANINNQYNITSQVLTDEEFNTISNIINSRNVYAELTNGDLYPINLTTTAVEVLKKKYTKRHNRIELNFTSNANLNLDLFQVSITVINQGFDYNFDIIL